MSEAEAMKQLDKIIKAGFRSLGVNVSRLDRTAVRSPVLYHRTDLVLDVGANSGEYALGLRREGYERTIVSFEPLEHAHRVLVEQAGIDDRWVIHDRCAVGASPGAAEINVSDNSFSSSLLPMLAAHSAAAPESRYVGKEVVEIITLDSTFGTYYKEGIRAFLKIDTQGYERQVLDGAGCWLAHVIGVQLELSTVALYEHQELYEYFFQFLRDRGFRLWSLIPGFKDRRTGQLLQFDGIFVRPD